MVADYRQPIKLPVTRTISIIGGKWKPIILNCIGDRTIRFGKLNQIIPVRFQIKYCLVS
jgi:DNA-binding HxlR family transcriptional regulator